MNADAVPAPATQGHLADLDVRDARPYHLTDWIEAHPSWKSVSTRRSKADQVKAAFSWAEEQGRIDRNPFKQVRYREAERRPDLPDDTLERVCRLANKRYEEALRFLRLTACRLTELCEAEWADVDLDRGVWTIPRHKSRRFTGRAKVVALVPEAVELLRSLGKSSLEAGAAAPNTSAAPVDVRGANVPADAPVVVTGHIFRNNRGTPWTRRTLGQQLRRMKERFGIRTPASLHGIRHRFGTCAVAAGAPIKLVAQQMGHSSVTTTERFYVNLSGEIEAIRAAAEKGLPKKG